LIVVFGLDSDAKHVIELHTTSQPYILFCILTQQWSLYS
jgi:hypothetical protein